jgi:hypothetical protein
MRPAKLAAGGLQPPTSSLCDGSRIGRRRFSDGLNGGLRATCHKVKRSLVMNGPGCL